MTDKPEQNNDTSKPREFWIDKNKKGIWKAYLGPYADSAGLIHVIEFSAYAQLERERDAHLKSRTDLEHWNDQLVDENLALKAELDATKQVLKNSVECDISKVSLMQKYNLELDAENEKLQQHADALDTALAGLLENDDIECRGDNDCDHCYAIQTQTAFKKFREGSK